jgi:hypothetical protein
MRVWLIMGVGAVQAACAMRMRFSVTSSHTDDPLSQLERRVGRGIARDRPGEQRDE